MANHQALMAHPLGAVVAVVEAELTTPQRPTAECKGAEELAEAVKVEVMAEAVEVKRLAEVVRLERQAEVEQVERMVQAVVVVAKIRSCLKCLILLLAMEMAILTGAVLNQMAILAHLSRHQHLVQVAHVLKI